MSGTSDDAGAAPWNAADYARYSSLQEAMAGEVLGLLELRGDESVLDLGCGDGRLTARIAARVPAGQVCGVDASADMVAFANSEFVGDDTSRGNLRFEVADARALPYRDAYDLVVSFNALHWVPEQLQALRGIAAALRAGGRAQLRLVVKDELISLEAVAEQMRREPRWQSHFADFRDPYLRLTAAEYARVVQHAGLRVVGQSTHLRAWDFRTDAAFFGFCKAGFGAWTRRLSAADGAAFVQDVISSYRLALNGPATQANVFRFYQMDIALT
jgi:trans-aconitate 2-methyltransferase